jgi:hypothetical protein
MSTIGRLGHFRESPLVERHDAEDLEYALALLERRYAEATSRFRRLRDEYHGLTAEPGAPAATVAAALARYDGMRRAREQLRGEIESLEARLF